MSFPRYAEYVDSGVEWLGEVPKDWELVRGDAYLRSPAKIVNADDLSGKEIFHYSIPIVQSTGDGQIEDGDEVFSSKLLVDQQQVLISKLNPRKNTVCIAKPYEIITVTSGEFVPLQSDKLDLRWVYYLVSSENFKQRLESLVESATRSHQRVNPSDILKFNGAFPISAEQTQIARFLDHETAKIDALIAEQKRLIKLLQEKRQAVISHAVSKGLDPNVPMKDSGVEWLGEVPAHWGMTRAKMVADIFIPQRNKPDLNDTGDGYYWVTMENMKTRQIHDSRRWISNTALQAAGSKVIKKGAVVASCVGNFGVASILSVDAVINQQLQAYIPKFVSASFLRDLIACSKAYFDSVGTAATLVYVNREGFANLPIPLPPKHEQRAIEEHIEKLNSKFDCALLESNGLVKILQERRSALISAAVTGKIDVRDWQPPADESAFDEDVQKAGMEASA